jgi:hypothetical protein
MNKPAQRSLSKTWILAILSILFILVTSLTIFSLNISRFSYNPERLKDTLEESIIESGLLSEIGQDYLAQWQATGSDSGVMDIRGLLVNLSVADQARIVEIFLPADFQASLISSSVDGYYEWLISDDAPLIFNWDLSTLKSSMTGEKGQEALAILFSALPECTMDHMNEFLFQAMSGSFNFDHVCRMPEPIGTQQQAMFGMALSAFGSGIPEEVELNIENSVSNEIIGKLNNFKQAMEIVQFFSKWGWIFSILLLVLLLAIGVRSLESAGIWVGLPLIISGMIVLALTVVARVTFFSGLTRWLGFMPETIFSTVINPVILRIFERILTPMLWHGVVILAAGGLLFIFMALQKMVKQPQ